MGKARDSMPALYTGNKILSSDIEGAGLLTIGNTFYVKRTADTDYSDFFDKYNYVNSDGKNSVHSTLQSAIDACVNWRGDRIITGRGTFVVTTPVLFNKQGITVQTGFDVSGEDSGERFCINADATANIAAAIISEPCTIIGLGFDSANSAGGTVTSSAAGSGFDGGNYCRFINCRFTNWGHAQEAVTLNYNDYVKFENCSFDGTINGEAGSANVFDSGLNITQGHYINVIDCTFRGCTYAITHGTPNPADADHSNKSLCYKGNKILDGKFVNWNTTATYTETSGLVADNWFGVATGTGVYSEAVATTQGNCTALRFAGNHYSE